MCSLCDLLPFDVNGAAPRSETFQLLGPASPHYRRWGQEGEFNLLRNRQDLRMADIVFIDEHRDAVA
jgi:hypothetical protein